MSILLPVGKVSKAFGLDGGALINLYDTFPDDINNEEPLFARVDGLAVPLFIEYFERRGRRGALVRFADIDTPARVGEFIGRELFVAAISPERAQGAGRGEHGGAGGATSGVDEEYIGDDDLFFDDLVGFRATITEIGAGAARAIEGEVVAFIDSEMNPLLQIDSGGREILIPAAEEFIDAIDAVGREITFSIPEGLLDLYM
ncbi:16S rRNA processing protein RimM [Alistipes sp. OttesenSCG-928-B03]|nr:16S rRNA processing protein RimM [Alistipes sp. OttesenSCG-928-B03]